jgi:hypothetical protein
MGSASSINIQSICIYISYDYREKNNLYIRVLRDELRKMNLNIIYSEITSDSLSHLSSCEISENIKNIMTNTSYFILCVSKETIRSFYQAIEIDNAFNTNKQILYLMIDEFYTPLNNQFVKCIVSKNKWMSLYNDETALDTLKYLFELDL